MALIWPSYLHVNIYSVWVNGLELLWVGCGVSLKYAGVESSSLSLWWWFDLSPPPPVSHRLMKQTVFTKHMQLHHLHAVRGKCIALLSDDAVRRGHRHLRCFGKAALFTEKCNILFDIKNKICVYTLGQLKYSRCSCFEFTCLWSKSCWVFLFYIYAVIYSLPHL